MALENIFPSSAEPLNTQVIVLWFVLGMLGRVLHSDPSLLMVHFKHRLLLRFVWLSDTLGSASSAAGSPPPELCRLPYCSWGGSGLENAGSTYSTGLCVWSLLLPINFPWNPLPSLGAACSPELEVWKTCFQSNFTGKGWLTMYLMYIRIGTFLEDRASWKKVQTQKFCTCCEQIICYKQTVIYLKPLILAPTPREAKQMGTVCVRYSSSQLFSTI